MGVHVYAGLRYPFTCAVELFKKENELANVGSAIMIIITRQLMYLGYIGGEEAAKLIGTFMSDRTYSNRSICYKTDKTIEIRLAMPQSLLAAVRKYMTDRGFPNISATLRNLVMEFFNTPENIKYLGTAARPLYNHDVPSIIADIIIKEITTTPEAYILNIRSKKPIFKFTRTMLNDLITSYLGEKAKLSINNKHILEDLKTALLLRGYGMKIIRNYKLVIHVYPLTHNNINKK